MSFVPVARLTEIVRGGAWYDQGKYQVLVFGPNGGVAEQAYGRLRSVWDIGHWCVFLAVNACPCQQVCIG